MTESTTEHRTTGAKWWGSVFHKKKKKKKMVEILTDCNARLTTMVEDQARLISSLTFENGRNDQIVRDYEQKIRKLTDDIAKLEDKSKRDQEFLESQRDKLQRQYYDIQILTSEKQDLSDTKTSLEQEKCDLINRAKEREQEILKYHETKQRLENELSSLKETNTSLQHDLTVGNQALYEETVTNKLLKKDYTLLEDRLTDVKTARDYADGKMDDLRKALLAVTSEKYRVENELGAQNECLKYELVMMKRMTDRKRKKIAKLERDKQLILQYYRNQETDNTRFDLYGFQNMHLEMSTFTDVPYAELLKNKVLNLEGQLYRRSQLTDELCDVIREYDPEFDLHDCPVLNQYLDSETMLGDGYGALTDYQHASIQNNPAVCQNNIHVPMSPDGSLEDCDSHTTDTTITSTSLDDIDNEHQSADNENDNQSANNSCPNQLSICVNHRSMSF